MVQITIPETYDRKLKALVTDPFEQTRLSIIQDLIDAELARREGDGGDAVEQDDAVRLNPVSPGSLVHTKVESAAINGRELHRPKWNGIREQIHLIARERLGSFDALETASDARMRPGRYEQEGFKYLPEGDFSIQGTDSTIAWEQAVKLAEQLGVSLKVRFLWRQKEGAARPGEHGVMDYAPSGAAAA